MTISLAQSLTGLNQSYQQSNLETLDNLAARHRTLEYEYERATKNITTLRNTNARLEGETMAWKSRCAELEKRLCHSDEREKGLREEVGRGRKALESVRIAAGVSVLFGF